MTELNEILQEVREVSVSTAIKAAHERGLGVQILVDVTAPEHGDLEVPLSYSRDGLILLNLTSAAIRNFFDSIETGSLIFNARFGGKDFRLVVPKSRVIIVEVAGTPLLKFSHVLMQEKVHSPDSATHASIESKKSQVDSEIEGSGGNVVNLFNKKGVH